MSIEEAEVIAVEKLNKLLIGHNRRFIFKICPLCSSGIEIYGSCIGRRFWKDILQAVNSFADMALNCRSIHLYDDFLGLESKDIFELLVKLDMRVK